MRLFRVATRNQIPDKIVTGSIFFETSNGQKLEGIYDFVNAEFLCKYDDRYFVSPININTEFGLYVDDVRRKIVRPIRHLQALYLIVEESDSWPNVPILETSIESR